MKPSIMSQPEWDQRCALAAAHRLTAHFGWDDLVFGHLSARVPDEPNMFLVTPFGRMFNEVTARNLIKTWVAADTDDLLPRVNPAGLAIHSGIYQRAPHVGAIMHTHSPYGVAVSSEPDGIQPLNQTSLFVRASLSHHNYRGVVLTDEEVATMVTELGNNRYMLLRNHGLLTVGSSVGAAFQGMHTMERVCKIQCHTSWRQRDPAMVALERNIREQELVVTEEFGGDACAWPALYRLAQTLGLFEV